MTPLKRLDGPRAHVTTALAPFLARRTATLSCADRPLTAGSAAARVGAGGGAAGRGHVTRAHQSGPPGAHRRGRFCACPPRLARPGRAGGWEGGWPGRLGRGRASLSRPGGPGEAAGSSETGRPRQERSPTRAPAGPADADDRRGASRWPRREPRFLFARRQAASAVRGGRAPAVRAGADGAAACGAGRPASEEPRRRAAGRRGPRSVVLPSVPPGARSGVCVRRRPGPSALVTRAVQAGARPRAVVLPPRPRPRRRRSEAPAGGSFRRVAQSGGADVCAVSDPARLALRLDVPA